MNRPRHSPSSKDLYRNAARLVALCAILLVSATGNVDSAATGRVRRVLILHSFGRDFAPFSAVASHFRTELARQSPVPVEFFEASLETARITEGESERPFVEYLRALLANRKLDLVAPFGAPAAHFMQRYRARLFPGTPMLIGGMDQRRLRSDNLDANSTSVTMRLELSAIVENILRVLPGTKSIAVVLGNSPLEKFWLAELRREFQPFTDRVEFIWLNELSFEEMRKRLAALQPNSAILYGALVVDATGVPHQQERALQVLRTESNAPIFGAFDNQLGEGIVGGALIPIQKAGFETARVANGIMNGESAGSIRTPPLGPGTLVYDWRELKRWGISESRLPPGSIVRFRIPSAWEQYHWYIIGGITIIAVQGVLIAGLIVLRARRRRAQAELSESEQRMDLAAEAAELGLWVRDLAEDTLWANAQLRSLLGFRQRDVLRSGDILACIHPDDRNEMVSLVERAQQGELPVDLEFRVLLPDGTVRWVVAKGRAVNDLQGRALRRMGAVFDITARKQAEEALRESQERLRLLLETTNAIPWEADARTWRFTYVGPQAVKLLGYPLDRWREAEFWTSHLHPDDREWAVEFCLKSSRSLKDYDFEYRMITADGQAVWIHDVVSVVSINDEPETLRGFMVDITRPKQAELEAARQRAELAHIGRVSTMGEMAASVAHELNQPLGAILSNAEAAEMFLNQEPPALGEVREILADIRKDDQRAGDVIQRLRAFLRKQEMELKPLDINELAQDVLKLLHTDAALRRVSIVADFTPNLPPPRGDRVQLQQVLVNLILNGMETITDQPLEKRQLTVRTARNGDGTVEVAVTDSGHGIPADKLGQIFAPFYTTKAHGMGMGLAISQTIIEAHGGRIWAENNPEGGATFRFTLPLSKEDST